MNRDASILFGKGGFCRLPVTEWDICCGSTGQREGGGAALSLTRREGLGGRNGGDGGGRIWMIARSLFFFFFLSPPGIVFIFIRYNCPLAGKTNPPPLFFFFFFWRGLMESRFHYNNLVMWAFWEARCGLKWIGHGSSQVFVAQSDLCSR